MKVSYDPRYNIAYIKLRVKSAERAETIRISEELNINISPDGKISGIELLKANEQLGVAKNEGLVLIDESTGETAKLSV